MVLLLEEILEGLPCIEWPGGRWSFGGYLSRLHV
jgi:hypothetical protein